MNRYWRRVGSRTVLSREGRRYREDVASRVSSEEMFFSGDISLRVYLYPPDRRRRDIDNVLKALLDALEDAGIYRDDCQVAALSVERRGVAPGGMALVEITECPSSVGTRKKP